MECTSTRRLHMYRHTTVLVFCAALAAAGAALGCLALPDFVTIISISGVMAFSLPLYAEMAGITCLPMKRGVSM